jgi:hypothetical protein
MQIQGSKRHRIRIRNTEKSFFNRFLKDIFIIEPESGSMFQVPVLMEKSSVADPDPADLNVFGPPGSGSTSQRYGSGSGSFYHHAKIVRKTFIHSIL